MSDDEQSKAASTSGNTSASAPMAPSRRRALRQLGYAASVAPAMVLLTPGVALARNGNGDPQAPCDNPAWDLGLKRAGHSGC